MDEQIVNYLTCCSYTIYILTSVFKEEQKYSFPFFSEKLYIVTQFISQTTFIS